jgi:hypothetical protein
VKLWKGEIKSNKLKFIKHKCNAICVNEEKSKNAVPEIERVIGIGGRIGGTEANFSEKT